ncbi:DUF559 domain-containing protein [Longivirga aurantiaca]|uniref:DUF559 domain-containing protein n=1 Tax=Longivirga aurantiaca TaxID=1837743 RepID=A0ABW1T453_9ACTN
MRGISTSPAVAAEQAGVFTRARAVEAGYTNFRIRHLLAQRRWSVVLGSVYVETASRLTPTSLAHAARLAGGLGVIVSHTTAGSFHQLRVPADPGLHVIVERNRRVRIPGLRAHRIEVRDRELVRVGGVVATDLVRTVADLLLEGSRVVVEFDGRAFRSDDVAFQRDRTRQNRLILAGYIPLRFTWDDVVHRPQHVVAEIRAALRAAA